MIVSFEDDAVRQAKAARQTAPKGITPAEEAAHKTKLKEEGLRFAIEIIRNKLSREPAEIYADDKIGSREASGYYEGFTPTFDVYTFFFCIESHVYRISIDRRCGDFTSRADWVGDNAFISIQLLINGKVEWHGANSPTQVGEAILHEIEAANGKPVIHQWRVPLGAVSRRLAGFSTTAFANSSRPYRVTDASPPTFVTWRPGTTPTDHRAEAKAAQLVEQVRAWHTQHGWPPPAETIIERDLDRIIIGWQHSGVPFYGRWIARNDRFGIFVAIPSVLQDLVGVRYADIHNQVCADITTIKAGDRLWEYVGGRLGDPQP